jgi:acyl-ACP thioesterase
MFNDIDKNDDINNVIYIEWILEALQENIWQVRMFPEVFIVH